MTCADALELEIDVCFVRKPDTAPRAMLCLALFDLDQVRHAALRDIRRPAGGTHLTPFRARELEEAPDCPMGGLLFEGPLMPKFDDAFLSYYEAERACLLEELAEMNSGRRRIFDYSIDITPEYIKNTEGRLAKLDAIADQLAAA